MTCIYIVYINITIDLQLGSNGQRALDQSQNLGDPNTFPLDFSASFYVFISSVGKKKQYINFRADD